MNRDSNFVYSLIAAHALLHQAQRDRDRKGQIIAAHDDYAAVYEITADLVSQALGASVSATVRETVEAVKRVLVQGGAYASRKKIREELGGLHNTTVGDRLENAISLGYLHDMHEGKKGCAAWIVLGNPTAR